MSTYAPVRGRDFPLRDLPFDQRRGIYAMWCVISTEAALFMCLYGAYFYLGNTKERWSVDRPPSMGYAGIMLAVMLVSAVILRWGEGQVKRERQGIGRIALLVTILLGLGFCVVQCFDYISHLKTLTPDSDSYGSIFYAISGFHMAHVVVGIMMMTYVLFLPRYGAGREAPYRPYQTVALYWYFVNVLWISVFIILYAIPNLIA